VFVYNIYIIIGVIDIFVYCGTYLSLKYLLIQVNTPHHTTNTHTNTHINTHITTHTHTHAASKTESQIERESYTQTSTKYIHPYSRTNVFHHGVHTLSPQAFTQRSRGVMAC